MIPAVEILFSEPVGANKYHVRLKHASDFKKVRELEKKECIPEYYYRPTVSLAYFNHQRSSRLLYERLILKPSSFSIGSGLNSIDWRSFSKIYNVDIKKKSNHSVVLAPHCPESYNRLMLLDPKSPHSPFICSPFFFCSSATEPNSFMACTNMYIVTTSFNGNNSQLQKNADTTSFTDDILKIYEEADPVVLAKREENMSIGVSSQIALQLNNYTNMYKDNNNNNNSSLFASFKLKNIHGIESVYFPIRPFINSNIIEISTNEVDNQYWNDNIKPTLNDYCWKFTKNLKKYCFYLKSYDLMIEFYGKHLLKNPRENMTNIRQTAMQYLPLNILRGIYPWCNKKCFTINMPNITRKSIQSLVPSVEFESIYIVYDVELNNTSLSDDMLELVNDYDPTSTKKNKKTVPNTAYVRIKNLDDAEKLMFANGKDDATITCHSMWNSSECDSVPLINEFTISGISSDVTLTDIKKWLGDIETNTIVRDGSSVRVFLCSNLQIDKLFQRNFTMFDNNIITINQSSIKVNEEMSGSIVHCFVKDTTQESLDALLDWASGINVRGYTKSECFENCFLLSVNQSDMINLLYRSGSKDYMGNEIFLRYAPSKYQRDVKFSKITNKIPTSLLSSNADNNSRNINTKDIVGSVNNDLAIDSDLVSNANDDYKTNDDLII